MSTGIFYEDRLYVQKMNKTNREQLFVEVNQPDLQTKIFLPLYNLHNNESHFFPKRIAILGNFKTGKTELGKYIIDKLSNHFKNCISLTINSKMAQYKSSEEIDDYIYSMWYAQLLQIDNQHFKEIIKTKLTEFREVQGHEPVKFIDKIYLICAIYRKFLAQFPDAKFVVEFDQANIITQETQFLPFFEFWRNFQGYWENDAYFSELPLFIFVIGHKNWQDFAALKSPMGRGVFDTWVVYEYWNNIDIEQMYRKRLLYAIRPEHQQKMMNYFLCNGIVDFFGKKLGGASTQDYLDQFFGQYLHNFAADFQTNIKTQSCFLDYCKKESSQKKSDDTYFQELERIFCGTPALDYMPVFRYLSDNQNEKWFEDLFDLITDLYAKSMIPFTSRDFMKFTNLTQDFVSSEFTYSPLTQMRPEYNPPIFSEFEGKLALNDAFKACLDAVGSWDTRGPIFVLKRYVKSTRIKHEAFVETKDGQKLVEYLDLITKDAEAIFSLVQKWTINKKLGIVKEGEPLNDSILTPFYKIRYLAQQMFESYKKNSTNWALFDNNGRELAALLVNETFPNTAVISEQLNTSQLKSLKDEILAPRASNIILAKQVSELLGEYLRNLHEFEQNPDLPVMSRKPRGVLVVIDGPNSLGEDYKDRLDLEHVAQYAHQLDRNVKMYYLTKIKETRADLAHISRLDYTTIVKHKDIDHDVKTTIRETLQSNRPPKMILLGVKDHDYTDFIKQVRKEFEVEFQLVISSAHGLAKSLQQAFSPNDIKYFPEAKHAIEKTAEVEVEASADKSGTFVFVLGSEGTPVAYDSETGKVCLPDRAGAKQPRIGERWTCEIKSERESCIILTLISKQ